MILRRFMQHVREQNWFAVGLDVIVVIVGIFLGLQVQNWYEEQQNLVDEKNYVLQMHDEAMEREEFTRDTTSRILATNDILLDIAEEFRMTGVLPDLNEFQCNAIAISHRTVNFFVPLNTIEELGSTGQSLIIKNEKIHSHMEDYKNRYNRANRLSNNLVLSSVKLPEKYPNLIKINSVPNNRNSYEETGNQCNTSMMNASDGFKNDLLFSISRFRAYASQMDLLHQTVIDLHVAIDEVVELVHEGRTQ